MQINTTVIEALFILVFISQIILLSWYYPRKILNRFRTVINKYPQSQFPKLYTESPEYYKKNINKYADICTLSIIACFVVVLISWNLGNSANEEMLVLICFFIQMLPILLLASNSLKHNKKMRETFKSSSRKADLQPRKLSDYIPTNLLGIALTLYCIHIFTFIFLNEFDFSSNTNVLITVIGTTLIHVYFAAIVFWRMHGRKHNPYISNEDRNVEIKVVANIAIYASIIMSLFLIITSVMDHFSYLDALDPMVLSIYFQVITVFGLGRELSGIKLSEMDFSVYKNQTKIDSSVI